MYRYLFANRWIALLFVVATAAGAVTLVGSEGEDGVIDQATQQITQQRSDFEEVKRDLAEPDKPGLPGDPAGRDEQERKGFFADTDLLDDAEGLDVAGFDPTPDPGNLLDPQPDHDPDPTASSGDGVAVFGPADIEVRHAPGAIPDEGIVE